MPFERGRDGCLKEHLEDSPLWGRGIPRRHRHRYPEAAAERCSSASKDLVAVWANGGSELDIEDIQDFPGGLDEAGDLAVDRDQDCSRRRRGQFHHHLGWQRMAALVNLYRHRLPLDTFLLPAWRQFASSGGLFRQSRRQIPGFVARALMALHVLPDGAALLLGNDDLNPLPGFFAFLGISVSCDFRQVF